LKALLISLQDYREQLGLKLLHYHLMAHGYDSTLFYLKYFDKDCSESVRSVRQFLKDTAPAFIGVSLMSIDYYKAIDITKIIREVLPETTVVWGGIHPTIYPEMCLAFADYVSMGESEQTLLDIAEAAQNKTGFEKINNIAYKKAGQLIKNPLNAPLENLDTLTSYEHIPKNCFVLEQKKVLPLTEKLYKIYDKTQGNSYSVVSSRGCPFSCTYCCNNFFKNLYNYKKIRRRSVDQIIEELERAVCDYPSLDFVNFEDDSFLSGSNDYIAEFSEKYSKKIKKPFIVHSIPVSITEEKIIALKKAGLAWVNVGLQSGSDNVLNDIYKRKSLKKDFVKATQILKTHHVAAFYDVLVDNPYETEQDKLATIETIFSIPKPFIIRVFSLTFYPGSELYDRFVTDFPELSEAYLEKNFCLPTNENYNQILKMIPFIFKWQSRLLISAFKRNPKGKILTLRVFVVKYVNVLFIKPFRLFKLIRMSYQGSYLVTMLNLRRYFVHYISKHLPAFSYFRNKGVLPF